MECACSLSSQELLIEICIRKEMDEKETETTEKMENVMRKKKIAIYLTMRCDDK